MSNQNGLVFDIQDLSVQDGPGIRTTVFLKGCPLRCRWCSNPEGQHHYPELLHNGARCRSCLSCLKACPSDSITRSDDGRPCFRRSACHRCQTHDCASACPDRAIRIAGRECHVDELSERARQNVLFYRNSGGGLTLSGGEPLSQPAFAAAVIEEASKLLLSVGLETCGHFEWDRAGSFIAGFDFIYYDVKCLDPARHEECTGKGNRLILDNLKRLSKLASERVIVSVPVVPGFNDNEEELTGIAALAIDCGIRRLRLLPYHVYGSGKYHDLGRRYTMPEGIELDEPAVHGWAALISEKGIECWVE